MTKVGGKREREMVGGGGLPRGRRGRIIGGDMNNAEALTDFLDRWREAGGAERANYQSFLIELCDQLGVGHPDPATPDDKKNHYVFDRAITVVGADGTSATNYIDLYKRGHFVLETKQGIEAQTPDPLAVEPVKLKKGHGVRGTKLWDDAMLRAKAQAEAYVRNIPDDNPPFLLVVDVGYSVETYADFSGLGKTYTPFPDNLSHRFKLTDLADAKRGTELLERLRKIFTDPQALNPARRTAKVTREIAAKLALLSQSFEKSGHQPEAVAHFLMRVLFTLFAEDVGLIPNNAFTRLLTELENTPQKFAPMAQAVWQNMDRGGFSPVLREDLLRFNGGLFADTQALPLTGQQLTLLIEAAKQDWSDVEPAIFGTLLERALQPTERHKLGAHYTPRAYVERLVLPTVIEPLREEWQKAQESAVKQAKKGEIKKAIKTVGDYLKHLCSVTVLDPACGSGNFLYVTLEHLKRLEGEVHDFLRNFEHAQLPLEYTGLTVDPHQLRGIEINPRAAAITDLVLWIGYLQWHFRTHGQTMPAEPVLKKFDNIECRDAVLAYDKKELARDEQGKPLSRWDGVTTKKSPITGEDVPEESARTPIFNYINPRKAEWPRADYVVGNPPFIGNKRMRSALGDGYADGLRAAHEDVPETADFVMYWWNAAANLLRSDHIRRFGFITTNSITQTFSRKVVDEQITRLGGISLVFAIPDHPWVESADGASVRIAMTTVTSGNIHGALRRVVREEEQGDESEVELDEVVGVIHPDLSVGTNVGSAIPLRANEGLCFQGCILVGDGFCFEEEECEALDVRPKSLPPVVKKWMNGRDLLRQNSHRYAIDLFGLSAPEAMRQWPALYQRVLTRVKPFRDQVNRKNHRENWWIFGEARPGMRRALAGLPRYVATVETSKHKPFVFLPAEIGPDHKLYVIANDDAFTLGVLSSRVHQVWARNAGGTLEDRPTWTSTTCFLPFPFPYCNEKQKQKIRGIAEELDGHRKRQQAKYPDLTLTDMYNVLEKLRAMEAGKMTGAEFSPKDKTIHDHGLVAILKQLHEELDRAVFEAYGWDAGMSDEALLEKLVALNHERAEEEKRGVVRYLRPEFQERKERGNTKHKT